MNSPDHEPESDHAPMPEGDLDVNRLLAEAEMLVKEIAINTGTAPDDSEADSVDEAPSPHPASTPQPEPAGTTCDEEPHAPAAKAEAHVDRDSIESEVTDASAAADAEHHPSGYRSEETDQPDESADGESARSGDVVTDAVATEPAQAGSADFPPEAPQPATVLAMLRRIPRRAAGIASGLVVKTLMTMDRPFAALPPTAKMCIGWIGLITLAMGLVALFLPKFAASNPYVDMKPYAH